MSKVESSVVDDIDDDIIVGDRDESELSKVVNTLLNEKWRRRKTRLNKRAIAKLTTIDILSQIYDIKFLRDWVDNYTEYVTSIDGRGRQEIVDITKYSIDKEMNRDKMLMEHLGRR